MQGKGHAGGRKKAYNMTGLLEEVMLEREKGMWHDGIVGRGHAGEGKKACGMTSMGTGTP